MGGNGGGGNRSYMGPNGSAEKVDYSRLPIGEGSDGEGEDWIQRQIKGHKAQIEHQDVHLSEIGQSASRLGNISLEISKELDQQNKMLDNVNTDLEEAIGGLDVVTKKTKDLIKKSGGLRNFMVILILVVILAVLVFLVIYT